MKKIVLFVALLVAFAICLPTARAADPDTIAARIKMGLEWLKTKQSANGSWGASVGRTGLAVKKFEAYAVEQKKSPLDPTYGYYSQVRAGLNFIFSQAQIFTPITSQPAGDPDSDHDGKGVFLVVIETMKQG
jgi:hypothetical protein